MGYQRDGIQGDRDDGLPNVIVRKVYPRYHKAETEGVKFSYFREDVSNVMVQQRANAPSGQFMGEGDF